MTGGRNWVDIDHLGADSLHQLQRMWELNHRIWASESVTHHTRFHTETRWPGYDDAATIPSWTTKNDTASPWAATTPTTGTGRWRRRRRIILLIDDADGSLASDMFTGRPDRAGPLILGGGKGNRRDPIPIGHLPRIR